MGSNLGGEEEITIILELRGFLVRKWLIYTAKYFTKLPNTKIYIEILSCTA